MNNCCPHYDPGAPLGGPLFIELRPVQEEHRQGTVCDRGRPDHLSFKIVGIANVIKHSTFLHCPHTEHTPERIPPGYTLRRMLQEESAEVYNKLALEMIDSVAVVVAQRLSLTRGSAGTSA